MENRLHMFEAITNAAERRALRAFSFWLNVGLVGLGILATGIAPLIERTSTPLPALTWLLTGAAVLALAWRRANAALRLLGETAPTADHTTSKENQHSAAGTPKVWSGLPASAVAIE